MPASLGEFTLRAVIALALLALLWRISGVLVPIFAGMLLAVVLRSVANLLSRVLQHGLRARSISGSDIRPSDRSAQ